MKSRNSKALFTYGLASPILSIRVKDEHTIVRKGQIKDEHERRNTDDGQPLQPNCGTGSFMIGCEAKEDQCQKNHHLKLLTKIHI
jgi:hypothetical protein